MLRWKSLGCMFIERCISRFKTDRKIVAEDGVLHQRPQDSRKLQDSEWTLPPKKTSL